MTAKIPDQYLLKIYFKNQLKQIMTRVQYLYNIIRIPVQYSSTVLYMVTRNITVNLICSGVRCQSQST